MIYHYPKTNRPKSHDVNEIIATKNAEHLGLPIFVILPGKVGSLREVKLGWVIDYDDKAEVFLIDFSIFSSYANISTSQSLSSISSSFL